MPRTPQFGRNICKRVMDTITAIAIPRSSHSDADFPAATTIFDAKTTQPDAGHKISIKDTKQTRKHTCKPECDGLDCKHHRNQELWLAISSFKINLFSSTARHHTAELEPYTKAGTS